MHLTHYKKHTFPILSLKVIWKVLKALEYE